MLSLTMLVYKRSNIKNSIGLKVLFLALIGAFGMAINFNQDNLGYLVVVIFIFCSLIKFTGFEVSQHSMKVKRYYFYSLFEKTAIFQRNRTTTITPFGLPFGSEGDISFPNADTEVGCLLSMISFFVPKPKISHRRFTIEMRDNSNNIVKSSSLMLNEEEYNLAGTTGF